VLVSADWHETLLETRCDISLTAESVHRSPRSTLRLPRVEACLRIQVVPHLPHAGIIHSVPVGTSSTYSIASARSVWWHSNIQ